MTNSNDIPKITTKQTEYLRAEYPNVSHLEAGRISEWLQERKDQLTVIAQETENEADTARLLGLVAAGVGTVCYAVNPLMLIGGLLGGASWLWFVLEHYNKSKEIAPLPFIRGNFLDALSRAGDFDSRQNYHANNLAETIKFLPLGKAQEFTFLYSDFELINNYLTQTEPGKRFYAYRWLFGWFCKFKGKSLPSQDILNNHLQNVTIDSRIKADEVKAIQQITTNQFSSLSQTTIIHSLPASNIVEQSVNELPAANEPLNPAPSEKLSFPLNQRATALIQKLIQSGFKIDEIMSSQVIAIAGTQRGGKGTLAGLLTILSKAIDPGLNAQYFTAGVDVYPFACNLISALKFSGRDADKADQLVAQDMLRFLKGLDSCHPYSHKNLLLVIDEAMRLLSLLEESDRTWAIQYLLSRFAKTGGTLIIVLHGSNLTSVVGKATAGLADTFKTSVSFIGCVAKPVSIGGLRKINVASGEYFKANPNDFGSPVANGQLGAVPDWLKTELHLGNGQPDPVRSLLSFFPELVQEHQALPMPKGEKLASMDVIAQLEEAFKAKAERVDDNPVEVDLDPAEQMLLSWIITRKTTGKDYDLNSANKNLDKLIKPEYFDSKAEYIRHLARQLMSKKKGMLINPNLFEPT